MQEKILLVEERNETGKNAMRRLRQNGFIPAILFSHGKSESIKISKKDFFTLFKGSISESVIFDVKYKEAKVDSDNMAYVKDYQSNPVTGEVIHVDFFKVTKGEKISTNVPIELVGAPVGVREGGVLEVEGRDVEVECLPKDLPEKIVVDISDLKIGDSIHASDLKIGEDVKLLSNPESVIAGVHVPRKIEEEEVEGEEILEEGEVAEGEDAPEADADSE